METTVTLTRTTVAALADAIHENGPFVSRIHDNGNQLCWTDPTNGVECILSRQEGTLTNLTD